MYMNDFTPKKAGPNYNLVTAKLALGHFLHQQTYSKPCESIDIADAQSVKSVVSEVTESDLQTKTFRSLFSLNTADDDY